MFLFCATLCKCSVLFGTRLFAKKPESTFAKCILLCNVWELHNDLQTTCFIGQKYYVVVRCAMLHNALVCDSMLCYVVLCCARCRYVAVCVSVLRYVMQMFCFVWYMALC